MFFFAVMAPVRGQPIAPITWARCSALSTVLMAMTFVLFAAYGVFASVVRRPLMDRPRVVRRTHATLPPPLPLPPERQARTTAAEGRQTDGVRSGRDVLPRLHL